MNELLHVYVTDITGKDHEIWCDDWEEDTDSYIFTLKGKTVAFFHKDKVIGVEFKRRR